MKRYFYISDDLDDLEAMEEELEADGVFTPQIHVLGRDDADADMELHDHLHEVHVFMKRDMVHAGMKAAGLGAILAAVAIGVAYTFGLHQIVGWVPFVFLSVILFGFATWEGGLYGIQEPNSHFRQFQDAIKEGKFVFFVDADPEQAKILKEVHRKHPGVTFSGTGKAPPRWFVMGQQKWRNFLRWAP